jgi:hypothetical protein
VCHHFFLLFEPLSVVVLGILQTFLH